MQPVSGTQSVNANSQWSSYLRAVIAWRIVDVSIGPKLSFLSVCVISSYNRGIRADIQLSASANQNVTIHVGAKQQQQNPNDEWSQCIPHKLKHRNRAKHSSIPNKPVKIVTLIYWWREMEIMSSNQMKQHTFIWLPDQTEIILRSHPSTQQHMATRSTLLEEDGGPENSARTPSLFFWRKGHTKACFHSREQTGQHATRQVAEDKTARLCMQMCCYGLWSFRRSLGLLQMFS